MSTFEALMLGVAVGAAAMYLYGPKRQINIEINKEILEKITSGMVTQWLDDRGLVWMPKGMSDIQVRVRK